jgi:hypothetical protein
LKDSVDDTDKGQRERVPFGSHRRRLYVGKTDPKYVYHWFNDTQDRLQRAVDAGYEYVTKKTMKGDVGDRDVGNQNTSLDSRVSKRINDVLTAYLMRIKREFWEEDQKVKQLSADAVDEAIFGGGSDRVQNSYGLDVKYNRPR